MVLYDKNGNPKLYDSRDLVEIARLISDIHYTSGFIRAVIWDENPNVENSKIAKNLAKRLLEEDMKKYEKIVPEEIKKQFDFSDLEETCKKVLKKFLP